MELVLEEQEEKERQKEMVILIYHKLYLFLHYLMQWIYQLKLSYSIIIKNIKDSKEKKFNIKGIDCIGSCSTYSSTVFN